MYFVLSKIVFNLCSLLRSASSIRLGFLEVLNDDHAASLLIVRKKKAPMTMWRTKGLPSVATLSFLASGLAYEPIVSPKALIVIGLMVGFDDEK